MARYVPDRMLSASYRVACLILTVTPKEGLIPVLQMREWGTEIFIV